MWVRMSREEAKAAGYDPNGPQGTKKATPTRKKTAAAKKEAADG